MELKTEFQQKNREQIEAHIKQRAADDPSFRQALVSDARSALKNEIGLELPQNMKLQVIEESSDTMALVLPPASGELADMELEAVAGGKQTQRGIGNLGGRIGGGGRVVATGGQN